MGHYCRICGRIRANERFSGKGHRIHVCQECARLPQAERRRLELEDEISGFLWQSHISKKNCARLKLLAASTDQHIAILAHLVLEVALFKPYKKRRWKLLAAHRPDLLEQLVQTGLILEYLADHFNEREDQEEY
ncbi:MAG: hypothetical protein FJ135_04640 [Deltaproteobacteria bacterium]|nr:hypothetical protein [Deltaproteobacteria bacterium]